MDDFIFSELNKGLCRTHSSVLLFERFKIKNLGKNRRLDYLKAKIQKNFLNYCIILVVGP